MASSRKKIIFIFITLFLILGGVFSGFLIGKSQCKICPPEDIDFSLFWEAYHKLQENFVDKEKFNIQEIIYGAIAGMTKSLGDPYTTFFTPQETKRFFEDVKGEFEGVGMEIAIKKGKLQVISPLEGTPAKRAGIKAGDEILKVNDTSTVDMTLEEAVNLIRGPKGTEVILTIYRKDWDQPREIKLIRDVIKIPTLKWEIIEGDIAYIKIYQFSEKTTLDFSKAAVDILKSPAKRIILDLRDNPGGLLDQVIEVSGWFLERGNVVAIEDRGQEKEQKFYDSPGPGRLSIYPTVVLINQGSASGAEILAGALKDNRGIILIGERSFGKGSVQEPLSLRDRSSLKVTVAQWLTPNGKSIFEVGLEPDVQIEMTEEDYEKGLDPQLNRAIEIIKEIE